MLISAGGVVKVDRSHRVNANGARSKDHHARS